MFIIELILIWIILAVLSGGKSHGGKGGGH